MAWLMLDLSFAPGCAGASSGNDDLRYRILETTSNPLSSGDNRSIKWRATIWRPWGRK